MLKAGVHFGHKKARWNPKMKEYIFGVRNGIHIIDLEKSLVLFKKALAFMEEIFKKKGLVLIVGTKNQSKKLVQKIADEMELPYVNNRWLGGTFTNFNFIKNRVKFLINNKEALEQGRLKTMTKLERNKLQKKIDKIAERMGGLVRMTRLPEAVFILDINQDSDAVREAKKMGIKIIGLVDTNTNPDLVDYPIPANDDAVSSLKYILEIIKTKK
jgi:small subunit ribosomal protein S2